jgi:hypothetical protein
MKDVSQIFDRWKDHVIGWDDVLLRSFEQAIPLLTVNQGGARPQAAHEASEGRDPGVIKSFSKSEAR